MATAERQLFIFDCAASTDWKAVERFFAKYGEIQNCFGVPQNLGSSRQGRVTFKEAAAANCAYVDNARGCNIGRQSLRIEWGPKKKGRGDLHVARKQDNGNTNAFAGTSRLRDEPLVPAGQQYLAPAPRPLLPTVDENGLREPIRDSWEQSLEDPDYDDGFVPVVMVKIKAKPIEADEWVEAYTVIRDFARYGGAIMAVDCEAWDIDNDLIIELGMASVQWRAGNAIPPAVKAEHIIVKEHEGKRNGTYSPDARDRFVFGKSKHLSEDKLPLYLKYKMVQLAKDPDVSDIQHPLIVVVHDARSEKQYFELMGISLATFAERVPTRLLEPVMDDAGNAVFKARDRNDKLLFDTQRLWKAYMKAMELDMEKPPLSLGGICKKLGINVKYLHNAGNDALYTLKALMRMAELYADKVAKSSDSERMSGNEVNDVEMVSGLAGSRVA